MANERPKIPVKASKKTNMDERKTVPALAGVPIPKK
jgi:hypothetical protein